MLCQQTPRPALRFRLKRMQAAALPLEHPQRPAEPAAALVAPLVSGRWAAIAAHGALKAQLPPLTLFQQAAETQHPL
jgi:hypothetical protein